MNIIWYPKKNRKYDAEFNHILDQLYKYPVYKVPKPNIVQSFGRTKPIRMLSRKKMIFIEDRVISLPYRTVLKKDGDIFKFIDRTIENITK